MLEFAQVYVRSIVGIVSMTTAVGYLGLTDATLVGGYFAAVVACVLLDKGEDA